MLIRTVLSPLLGACCYVVGDEGGPGFVVDPGFGVVPDVLATIRAARLEVRGVLVTHGHVDHTWAAAELCTALDVPLHVHEADLARIRDPFTTLGPLGAQLAEMAGGRAAYREPEHVRTFTGHEGEVLVELGVAGVDAVGHRAVEAAAIGSGDGPRLGLRAMHCPGHTQGSTVYLLEGRVGDGPSGPVALTGDVLFAGSVGRTDLPGGDDDAMARTLHRLVDLDPATLVLPGHGPSSTIGQEVARNPYLGPRSPFLRG